MVYIYDENLKLVDSLNYDILEFQPRYFSKWKEGYHISKDKIEHPKLAEGRLEEKTREERILLDNEIDLLSDGEYVKEGKILYVPKPNRKLLKILWNKEINVWEETATQEELRDEYIKTINNLKTRILETGFDFTHSNGNVYKQKLRPYKDIPLATSTKSFLKRHSEHTVTWSFDDEHMNVEMTLEEIERLEDEGVIYTNAVFEVERDLKSSEVNLDLTFEDFDKLVKEKLNSFTFSLRGVLHE